MRAGASSRLAADHVWARRGVVLNPHYKSMGNLYGSEYWTYLLPRRVGDEMAAAIVGNRLPIGAPEAVAQRLIDDCFEDTPAAFLAAAIERARAIANDARLRGAARDQAPPAGEDEVAKPLEAYRAEELARMQLNFFGFDPSYHVARYHFVYKLPKARTPSYLAAPRSHPAPMRARRGVKAVAVCRSPAAAVALTQGTTMSGEYASRRLMQVKT